MPPRRNNEKFQRLIEFERGRNIGLQEGGFSYRAIGARVQRNSSTVMRVWKQWADEHRKPRKTVVSTLVYYNRCTNVNFVNSSTSAAPWRLPARVPLYRIPLTANHQRLRLQWAREYRAWQADWHQVVFSDELRFNLWGHNSRIRVRRYAAIFHQDNARPHVEKTARDFCSVQHMTLLPWPAYLLDTSSIEHVWDLVGRGLARDPRPAASKDELLLRIQAIWNSPPQVDIQNLFDCIPRRIATFIAARGGYTKY
ncbi:transposable element Tcb2 transposase [Trichonephila clavipes]|uniref:Transposable element Tcb2 transposase n=1 Tax=Trichonephila clavipes TaxID=2585209 RepID=A0A8X6R152_TRICX|nr:transposable element Tcb2 transposase [Trichonephila clavipes]